MNTATPIGMETVSATGAVRQVYKLSVPLEGNEFVLVSALPCAFDTGRPETYIFACTEDGKVTSFAELDGSFRGNTDPVKALRDAGYEIKTPD